MLIQLLRSEPLEPRLENGKRLHYNFKFAELLITKKDERMNQKKAYWFEQPYVPRMKNVAVAPLIQEDGRLSICVPGDDPPWSGIWNLTGKVILDGDDYFEFQCDDKVMHMRGGTYKFHALDIDAFRNETCWWISEGKQIAECCRTTEELHQWYLDHWTYNR